MVRGIRGAVVANENAPDQIAEVTKSLLQAMQEANGFKPEELAAIIISATPDISASYPAAAIRSLGWKYVPLLDVQELNVNNGINRCIRVLVLWNTPRGQEEIRHIYLGETAKLRPDLAEKGVDQ